MLLCACFSTFSQQAKGIILDKSESGIDEVYIINLTTNSHAHTNDLGLFSIDKTSNGDKLRISKLGYKPIIITVEDINIKLSIILENTFIELNEVVLSSGINTTNNITKIDLLTNPVNSSQEILRQVPGLFIGQHAGGGKAEQLFLRGFDIDHGTDVALSVDGMPVNMVSHAHGQGYSDLHFIIPETVNTIDFGKGPYQANQGNFATAGFVGFKTKDKLENSSITMEAGQFNTMRMVGLFNVMENSKKQNAYLATEYILTDGPFDSPQNFNRLNLFGKYNVYFDNASKLTVQASRFSSRWDASGQIPNRLVQNGTISRFGAVDDTEGGSTSRSNLILSYQKSIDENTFIKSTIYYSNYDFTLFSNFTFFLNNPINGDQIKQKENRNLYGTTTEYNQKLFLGNSVLSLQSGIGFRADEVDGIALSRTANRKDVLENIQLGNIDESNVFGYFNSELLLNKFKITPAIRFDYFKFNYQDHLSPTYTNLSTTAFKVSPKLNFSYSQSKNVEFFVKSGFGFHSNDTRVALQEDKEIVPSVFGVDIGNVWKPTNNLIINTALWSLYSQQEFVYVGDEGIVEPSGKSRRFGVDFGLRYQFSRYLFADFDANYSFARTGENFEEYIPLAPKFSSTGGLIIKDYKGFSSALNYRYLGDRAANEDNSILAEGYFVTDFKVNYTIKKLSLGFIIENIFNTKWNETQFLTASQLQNESQAVEEIHFTPGTPFLFKFKIGYNF